MVFVNDASRDGSERLLRSEFLAGDIVLVNMSRNFGASECMIAGLAHASGDAIIYMDADLQDPPEVIGDMVEPWRNDPKTEVVFTTRTKREGEHWLKMLITHVGYRIINAISDIELHPDSRDFKLLSRRAVAQLIELREDKPYMRRLVSWIGFKQPQVFYEREARFDGAENIKMRLLSRKVIYYWLDRALISFSDSPLKLILALGFLMSFLSTFYIVIVVIQKILNLSVPGWAALMSSMLFLSGVQMMMLGFIGLYVGAIFREAKRRPQYIVKEVLRK